MNISSSTNILAFVFALALFTSCSLPTTSDSMTILEESHFKAMISSVEVWPHGSTDYSQASWSKLIATAKVIQTSAPTSVETALRRYQLEELPKGQRDFTRIGGWHQVEDDSKLFLLMRIVFAVPESVPMRDHQFIPTPGGWIVSEGGYYPDGTANLDWPIKWENGHPKLVAKLAGVSGINLRYDAAEDYRYFLGRYPKRDLSAFDENGERK